MATETSPNLDFIPFGISPPPWRLRREQYPWIDVVDALGQSVCFISRPASKGVLPTGALIYGPDARLIEAAPVMLTTLVLLRRAARRVLAGDERCLTQVAAAHASADTILAALEAGL